MLHYDLMIERPDFHTHYRNHIFSLGIKDVDCHHEFVNGEHGEKVEMEIVYNHRKSGAYLLGLSLKARMIVANLQTNRLIILGIADGATQHGRDLSQFIKSSYPKLDVVSLDTSKRQENGSKIVELDSRAHEYLATNDIGDVVLDDDVGTTGSSTAQVVEPIRMYGPETLITYYDVLRRQQLRHLDALNAPYYAVVNEDLPNYSPDDCSQTGLCAQGSPLTPYPREQVGGIISS